MIQLNQVGKAFDLLILLGWVSFALSTLRMDYWIAHGDLLYLPRYSLGFEIIFFLFLFGMSTIWIIHRWRVPA